MKKTCKTTKIVSKNLTAIMDAHDMKAPELALLTKKLGYKVTARTINNILNIRHDPGIEAIEAVSRALGVEPWQMLMPNLGQSIFSHRNKAA